MNSVKIHFLGEHLSYIPLVAQWHQSEWHHISPDLTTKRRIELYSRYTNTTDIPVCFLALTDNKPAGTASLVESDLKTHPQLTPWLASVYVHKNYRCQGIASKLIEKCIEAARQSKINKIYLFTPDMLEFYKKRGWKLIESTLYHGENIDIMVYDL